MHGHVNFIGNDKFSTFLKNKQTNENNNNNNKPEHLKFQLTLFSIQNVP